MKSISPLKWVSSYRLVIRLLAGRKGSLSVMTLLGWVAISSLGASPQKAPSSAVPSPAEQAVSSAVKGSATTVSTAASILPGARLAPSAFQLSPLQSLAQANSTAQLSGNQNPGNQPSGNQIRINGRTLPGFWQQKDGRIGIASTSVANLIGAELMSTTNPRQQPIRWFPVSQDEVIGLPAWWDATNRYIDVSDLVASGGWSAQPAGNMLQLTLPQQQTLGIRQGKQTWGDRIVVDVSGPTTWQMEATDVFTVQVGGTISPELLSAFRGVPGNLITQLHAAPLNGQTVLKIKTKDGAAPHIWTAGSPNRVVIDIRRDAMVERDVTWAPGLRWRQQYISVGQHRFPVYMFITRPDPATMALRPISTNPQAAPGITPILSMAQRQQVAGAVNAGFFNRNNQLPLGAVRNNGKWVSGPE